MRQEPSRKGSGKHGNGNGQKAADRGNNHSNNSNGASAAGSSNNSSGSNGQKGRPRTVQEAMTAGGFDRLKKTGGWQSDLCGPQPVQVVMDLTRQSCDGKNNDSRGLRLG